MNPTIKNYVQPALVLLVIFTVVTGLLFPLVTTGLAQLLFSRQANGSLVQRNGHVVGSTLIGQNFTSPRYFWSRPSATSPTPYNAQASTGSNLGPSNPALATQVSARIAALRAADPSVANQSVPVDLVTSSASGLDPDISPAAAYFQASRIARERSLPLDRVRALILSHSAPRSLTVLGEPSVNVLALNLALDDLESGSH